MVSDLTDDEVAEAVNDAVVIELAVAILRNTGHPEMSRVVTALVAERDRYRAALERLVEAGGEYGHGVDYATAQVRERALFAALAAAREALNPPPVDEPGCICTLPNRPGDPSGHAASCLARQAERAERQAAQDPPPAAEALPIAITDPDDAPRGWEV